MKKYRILNLYACLGGNRYKWDEVSDNIEVVAVELDSELAKLYQERFPNDKVIVADAHQYLLDHYKEFDFIWTSPPCPTHSKVRMTQKNNSAFNPMFPDMKLYEEILFLDNYFDGKYVVENVVPYYQPLVVGKKRGRHIYWTNFNLPNKLSTRKQSSGLMNGINNEIPQWCEYHEYDFYKYKGNQRRDKIARNLVDYEAGRTILETAMEIQRQNDTKQVGLFDALT
ncbi:MAG: DNA cytosine methyltransferase [Bacteroidetes bacterium]|jgi:DNA (cytosine-5)-methyltransferase 1|nr:DNA cytosine methyltransferase [Bacteroidota bacterium]